LIGCEVEGPSPVPDFRYVAKEDAIRYLAPGGPLVSGPGRGKADSIYIGVLTTAVQNIKSFRHIFYEGDLSGVDAL